MPLNDGLIACPHLPSPSPYISLTVTPHPKPTLVPPSPLPPPLPLLSPGLLLLASPLPLIVEDTLKSPIATTADVPPLRQPLVSTDNSLNHPLPISGNNQQQQKLPLSACSSARPVNAGEKTNEQNLCLEDLTCW